ncbi:hypothetical protein MGG_16092 [Pyricularia oryzae 70-15]|uniref:Uncharacterized protein n=1 Tax=Pyricularia oryzae (strain 70-15 / ATCC MYA-4617 / FGSC 8958) TaxID=242507 RepID=G4MQH7_PYRO7|nr:uncharacterized protein MGG_16092 [Pyricularia oryzae 70-15]EHA56467.1 hypothetical protein MGG_16092 [Pyricularia oryzae 70-15]
MARMPRMAAKQAPNLPKPLLSAVTRQSSLGEIVVAAQVIRFVFCICGEGSLGARTHSLARECGIKICWRNSNRRSQAKFCRLGIVRWLAITKHRWQDSVCYAGTTWGLFVVGPLKEGVTKP